MSGPTVMDLDGENFSPQLAFSRRSPSQTYGSFHPHDPSNEHSPLFKPAFFDDGSFEANLPTLGSGNASPQPNGLHHGGQPLQSSSASPPQGSDSHSNSLDTSDTSSAKIFAVGKEHLPGRIPIPADSDGGRNDGDSASVHPISHVQGDELFDFESAASSPSPYAHRPHSNQLQMSMNAGVGRANFGYGPSKSDDGLHGLRFPPERAISQNPPAPGSQLQFIQGSDLESMANFSAGPRSTPDPATSQATKMESHRETPVELLASNLPKTQRVETQMHVKLTMWPLPPGVTKLHFQSHTMARTKLVVRPPAEKTPAMLELFAHCVCATAMDDPERKKRALKQAARSKRAYDGSEEGLPSQPRSLQFQDDDPDKPLNGGFVFICEQCIQRENKRLGRKKLKNENEEALWLEDQPKRIIVFNKSEIMDWERWQEYPPKQGKGDAPIEADSVRPTSPDDAFQVCFPMRIQCYSRHHGEKLGYRVIFTIKDSNNRLVAQTMTTPSIITDDHKTQPQPKLANDMSPLNYPDPSAILDGPGVTRPRYTGTQLGNRNSFSTPNLQSLNLKNHSRGAQSQGSIHSYADQDSSQATLPPSRNGSRPASPTLPMAPQTKRRKGSSSSHGRLRSELTMTKFHPTGPESPQGPAASRSSFGGGSFQQQYNPVFSNSYGQPASAEFANSTPSTPGVSSYDFHQQSQSLENLQGYNDAASTGPSVHPSSATSAGSSPQQHSGSNFHPQPLGLTLNSLPSADVMQPRPRVHKITPSKSSLTGGIEVTCLGDGFSESSNVFFGDVMATKTGSFGQMAITCIVPPVASPRMVNVTVNDTSEQFFNNDTTNPILFEYVHIPDEGLMRRTLQIFNRQLLGKQYDTQEFTQKMLSSINEGGQSNQSDGKFSLSQSQQGAMNLNVEEAAMNILEVVDLDEKPMQADLNERGDTGHSILHLAAFLNHYRLVSGLLARGADFDVRDYNGMTPMHLASLRGNVKIIRKLRSSGADPTIRSLDGRRPADLADEQVVQRTAEDVGYHHVGKVESFPWTQLRPSPESAKNVTSRSNAQAPFPTTRYPRRADDESTTRNEPCHRIRQTPVVSPPWHDHPSEGLASISHNGHFVQGPGSPDATALAVSTAMSAWKEQVSAQIQQLQQHLQRALPMIPTLPDYQAYPVMRRISNLVPQRTNKPDHVLDHDKQVKDVEYRWWELITGPTSSPPAYEDIYPDGKGSDVNYDGTCYVQQLGKSPDIRDSPSIYDHLRDPSASGTISMQKGTWTKHQQDQIRRAHARKVKKLRSDRNLFFIWIPLLLLVLLATLQERKAEFWNLASRTRTFVERHAVGTR